MDSILVAFLLAGAITIVGGLLLGRIVATSTLTLVALGAPVLFFILVPLADGLAKSFSLFGFGASGLLMLLGASISTAAMIAALRADSRAA